MASGSLIGALRVTLGLDSAEFTRGTKKAQTQMTSMQKSMATVSSGFKVMGAAIIGSGVIAGLSAIASNALEMGSALTESASKVGVTVETLQEMRYVAEQNGVAVDTMEGSLNKMSKTLGELQLGNKTTANTFRELGLSAQQMVGLTPSESFIKIAEALGRIEDETVRAALGNKVFGKSYAELKPLVDLGAEGIRKAVEEKRRDGVVSTEQAQKLDELADGWARLKEKVGVATAQFVANTAGSGDASRGLENVATSIGGLIKEVEKLLMFSRKIDQFFLNIESGANKAVRNWAVFNGQADLANNAQRQINAINAEMQRNSSNSVGPRLKKGIAPGFNNRSRKLPTPIKGAGGALAGSMGAFGAVDIGEALDQLDKKAATVDAKVATPVTKAVAKIADAFKELQGDVTPILDRLFPEVRQLLDYSTDKNNLEKWAKAGKLGADQLREALVRLRDEYFDSEGAAAVTPEVDLDAAASDQVTSLLDKWETDLPKGGIVVKRTFEDIADNIGRTADTVANAIGSMQSAFGGFVNSIKKGDVLGIIGGLADTIGSVLGAFGKGGSLSGLFGKKPAPIPGYAGGTSFHPGGLAMVGERGRELINLPRGSQVIPNHKLNGMGGARELRVQVIENERYWVTVQETAGRVVDARSPGIAAAGARLATGRAQYRQSRALD